jgi:peroxiredoxin
MIERTWLLHRGLILSLLAAAASGQVPETIKQGHSHISDAFDTGPREKPWEMKGTGHVNFPISTRHPEVQKWFNQGVAHAHNFWWYEAERAFRWCAKLEPENPMAWWGVALAAERGAGGADRKSELIKQAYKRRDKASPRERLWIEAYHALTVEDPLDEKTKQNTERERRFKKAMESLIVRYPDDLEAKAFLALTMMGRDRMGAESLLKAVLAKAPDHPGAHHYRIHNWNYHEAEYALDSCKRYGEIAFDTGHALHMPGHIYSSIGMWHEAAISMDSATRSEARYMKERMVLPFNAWNYPHNKNYLCRIQEQLGMARAAEDGARQLLAAPGSDAKDNYVYTQGLYALTRGLIKFERWNAIVDGKSIPWRGDQPAVKALRHYVEARAWFALGDIERAAKNVAEFNKLEKDMPKAGFQSTIYKSRVRELQGQMNVARGKVLEGLGILSDAAGMQFTNEEPSEIELLVHVDTLWNVVGNLYLQQNSPALAVKAFERALHVTRNDGFALAGLVRAWHALGETEQARNALARLLHVWGDADAGSKPLERALATGLKTAPKDSSPAPQRNYVRTALEKFGPNRWEPYAAPALDAVDIDSKRVTLEEYRGKNVLMVFYLGEECPHCLQQLVDLTKRKNDFSREDTVLLAISKTAPSKNKEALKLGEVGFRLLSDPDLSNTRRFKSYDDFEEMEIHSTILIDKQGRVHWARHGGDPFTDFDFLLRELRKMNSAAGSLTSAVR